MGGLLQRGNIHLKVCPEGGVPATLDALRQSPTTTRHKAKFILATDGTELHAENLADDVPPLACEYRDLPNHFGFFLPLAGITTVRQISENAFDILATGRLNRLYVELSKHNPDWDTRREDLNHFFARLIFCFFAEDTGIFPQTRLFTDTIEMMTERDGSNPHQVLAELFRAMNTRHEDRAAVDIPTWAMKFPYVNGGLFSGSPETPRFSKTPAPTCCSSATRLEADQPRHLRLDDPSCRRRRGTRRPGHALHQRAEHPQGPQSELP